MRASKYEDDDGPGAYAVVWWSTGRANCATPTPAINSFSSFSSTARVHLSGAVLAISLAETSVPDAYGKATNQLRDVFESYQAN